MLLIPIAYLLTLINIDKIQCDIIVFLDYL